MALFLTLLPIFLFGNVHCLGMCGPLVALLARQRYKWLYFPGRLLSFSFGGLLAGEMGLLLFDFSYRMHLSALFSLVFGVVFLGIGVCKLVQFKINPGKRFQVLFSKSSAVMSALIKRPAPPSLFLFGASTLLLPCGQSLLVFSIIALYADPLLGLTHGFLFALFTSPALILAMYAPKLLKGKKLGSNFLVGLAIVTAGLLATFRGLADLELMPHYIVNQASPSPFHIVLW